MEYSGHYYERIARHPHDIRTLVSAPMPLLSITTPKTRKKKAGRSKRGGKIASCGYTLVESTELDSRYPLVNRNHEPTIHMTTHSTARWKPGWRTNRSLCLTRPFPEWILFSYRRREKDIKMDVFLLCIWHLEGVNCISEKAFKKYEA